MKLKSFFAIIFAELIAFAPISVPISTPVHAQATILPPGKQCFQATAGVNGMVGTIGAITGGTGYVNGSYGGVPLTGGSGTNATANITVAGGIVSAVTILNPGAQYVVGDVLSAAAATIGGSGSGFSFPVASTSINSSLAGGTVAYYIPSTLTTKQTWQDAFETILNQNPVPLDANGCAIVYGNGTYRQILKDSLSDTVWDVLTSSTGASSASSGTVFAAGVPVGTILPWSATFLPTNYLYTAGQAISRTTYAQLLTAVTYQQNISCQIGIATITVPTSVSDGVAIGVPIEASCFPPGTVVSSKTSGQLTMSNTATATVSTSSILFPWGNGDGATTFNLPDLRGRVVPGRDNMNSSVASRLTTSIYGANPDAINAQGGNQSYTFLQANLPNVNFVVQAGQTVAVTSTVSDVIRWAAGTGSSNAAGGSNSQLIGVAGAGPSSILSGGVTSSNGIAPSGGAGTPFGIVQPSVTSDYIIKALPDTTSGGLTGATNGVLYNNAGSPGVTAAGINGQLLLGVTGSAPLMATMSQDCVITNTGAITCTKTNNVAFAPSATTDTTNASNISSGTIASARLPNATNAVKGAMEGDGTTVTCVSGVCTAIGAVASNPGGTAGQIQFNSGGTAFGGFTASGDATVNTSTGVVTLAAGVPKNVLNSKTTNYTIANTDCGSTIQAGTGSTGFFTVTLPSVSGFSATCVVAVKNGDTARGKQLSGFPSDLYSILGPSQLVEVEIINGVWATKINPGPYQLSGAANTLHVNHTSGLAPPASDCMGTGAGACDTIADAAIIFQSHTNCSGQQPFIQVDDSSFTENVSLNGVTCPGVNNLQIVGNATTPDNVVWNAGTASVPGLNVSDHATVIVNGFKLQCSISGAIDLQVNQGALLGFENIDFGNCGGGKHISVAGNGVLVFEGGTYTISGATFGFHLVMAGAGYFAPVGGNTVSVPNAMAFTQFYNVTGPGFINTTLVYSGTGAGAGSTGTKYSVTANGVLLLNTTTLPGATAGSTATGGQAF